MPCLMWTLTSRGLWFTLSEIVEVATLDELRQTLASHPYVLVEFGAAWCGPCRAFLPHFKQFAAQHPNIVCVKVDVDTDPDFVSEFGIQSVPQVFYFVDGEKSRVVESRTVVALNRELA